MKFLFLYNPRAGTRRTPISEQLHAFVKRHGLHATITPTTGPGHATQLAAEAAHAGIDVVVAVGGDGTINETGRGLLGTDTALAIIPCGSGNGLARHLGVPMSCAAALDSLLHSEPLLADVGRANGHPFFCAMGVGFDAAVVRRFNTLARRGLLAYVHASVREYFSYRAQPLAVRVDGAQVTRHVPQFVTIANGSQFGNGATIAPRARLDDGRLDLVVVRSLTLFNALPLACRLFTRTLDRSRHVTTATGTRFVIERDQPGIMHVDGELVATEARIEVEILPRALKLWAPHG